MAIEMTQKEMFAHIAEVMADDAQVVEFCEKKIEQLNNKKSSKRVNKEAEATRAAIATYMAENGDTFTASDIATGMDMSVRVVSSNLTAMKKAGIVEVVEIEGGTKSAPNSYALV
jgi:DNA-binding transcriptional ArsR family regulator